MQERIRVAFLGWSDEGRCLLEVLTGKDVGIEVVGAVLLSESEPRPPDHLRIPQVEGMAGLERIAPVTCLIDLRPSESERPEGLPPSLSCVSSEGVRIIARLCNEQRALRRYRQVVESAVDAVVTIDETHRILFFNEAAEAMFGFAKEEAIGQDLSLIIPKGHKERHQEYVRQFVATRKGRFINHTVELEAERRSGEQFSMRISFSVAEEGDHVLMTAVMRDITELKAAERRASLNERLASVGQTLSYMTHEIKNPLVVIGGLAHGLLRCPALEEKDRERLGTIVKEVERLERLLSEIHDFAKPLHLEKKETHLAQFLKGLVDFYEDSETYPLVTFSLDVKGDPVVSADPDLLRQVLVNLIKNALEAIKGPGRLTIRASEENEKVQIDVLDSGEGIAPERIEKIFEPFVTTKKGGSGLGLSQSRKIVHEHHGDLEIESPPGQGTRVHVTLPAAPSPR